MAANRAPAAPSFVTAAAISRDASSGVSTLGSGRPCFGASMPDDGIIRPPSLRESEAIELPGGRTSPRRRGRGQSPRADVGEPGLDVAIGGVAECPASQGQKAGQVRQIAAVGGQGMGRRPALGGHHFEEGLDPGAGIHGATLAQIRAGLARRLDYVK